MPSSTWATTISTSPPSFASDSVAPRLEAVRLRIARAGGDPSAVRVIAVTKGFGPEAVDAARAAGLTDVGENYAPELLAKAPGPPGTRWHFLGSVQRNKVRALAPVVGLWQSVARLVEGERIASCAPGAAVLVQVDCSGLPDRNGCAPAEVEHLVGELRRLDLQVRGLMTVAPQELDAARRAFVTVGRLADALGLPERSMGMSDDLEAAVAAGTTMVRLGRALFGERPPRVAA
ncbi:MAG TPA: YggS family pyridoxal phosphate enzyme [Acidimicrobiales bacterium]|nr:YggS family pyridoxal phosphate enzyme [Acidimicrobiales bacterium]